MIKLMLEEFIRYKYYFKKDNFLSNQKKKVCVFGGWGGGRQKGMTTLGELLLPLKVDHVEYKISNVLKKVAKIAIELSHGQCL